MNSREIIGLAGIDTGIDQAPARLRDDPRADRHRGTGSRQAGAGGPVIPLDLRPGPGHGLSTKEVQALGDGLLRVVVMDFGTKRNIVRSLVQRGCTVYLTPPAATAEEIMSYRPHGVVLSNGPGNLKDVWYAVKRPAA